LEEEEVLQVIAFNAADKLLFGHADFCNRATGFIGFAVATNLARVGHKVYGLARNAEKARRLSATEWLSRVRSSTSATEAGSRF
jgi:nucleoside-diphosphate-sugar epimerase